MDDSPDEKGVKTKVLASGAMKAGAASADAAAARQEEEGAGPSLVGVTLDDRYLLEERIGSGGLGEIYRARHLRMQRAFAVKLLQPGMKTRPDFISRFDREARALSRLTHPCCVAVTDYGVSEEHGPFIVMELVEGVPLSRYTRGEGLPLRAALELAIAALSGLEHAHGHGIVHRDIKPDNIMVLDGPLEPGRLMPKILDFGLAKIRAGFDAPEGNQLTQAGFILGTPHYMAPERVTNPAAADDPAADIYAIGVVLFELCCGRRPFLGEDMVQILDQHLTQQPPPPRSFRPALPAALEEAILKALAKQPGERFASAGAFRQALEKVLPLPAAIADQRPAEGSVSRSHTRVERPARRSPSPAPTTRPPSGWLRRPALLVGVLAVALAVLGTTLALVIGSSEPTAGPGSAPKKLRKQRKPLARKVRRSAPKVVASDKTLPATRPATPPVEPVVVADSEPAGDPEANGEESVDTATPASVPAALRSITRLWSHRRTRQLAAQKFMRYLANHRSDAAAHVYVGRLFLFAFWADDGLKLVNRGLKTDPRLRLDVHTLMALTFAYDRGSSMWGARKLLDAHAGPGVPRFLLASASAQRDMRIRYNLIADAQRRGVKEALDRKLLELAGAHPCDRQRAAFRALGRYDEPPIRVMLALLRSNRCLGAEARRLLKQ